MLYSILIIAICIYSYNWDKFKIKNFYIKYLPIFFILFLFVGLQYNVGSDYQSYISYATNDDLGAFKLNQLIMNKEFLFALIVRVSQLLGYPQSIFLISSFIQNFFLMLIIKILNDREFPILSCLLLYFGLSLCFFNQFNGIRQFISIYIFIYAFLLLSDNLRNPLGWICLLITPLFHLSSIFVIIITISYFFILFIFKNVNNSFNIKKVFFIVSLACFIIYFFDLNLLIEFIISKLNIYQKYLTSSYVSKMSFSELLTKILKLIVIFYSIYRLDLNLINKIERKIFDFSLLAIIVMILSFSSTLIWRFYLFFDFFIIVPVLLFFKYNATRYEKIIILSYLYLFLFVKIILLPRGEYLYQSIIGR